jgi:hypothetical protein
VVSSNDTVSTAICTVRGVSPASSVLAVVTEGFAEPGGDDDDDAESVDLIKHHDVSVRSIQVSTTELAENSDMSQKRYTGKRT